MTESVLINISMDVCDGSRATQVGRKSCNMLKGLVNLVEKIQQHVLILHVYA